jgi:hypothetical protein
MDDDIAGASMTDLGEPGGSVPKWSLCDIVVGCGMTDSSDEPRNGMPEWLCGWQRGVPE